MSQILYKYRCWDDDDHKRMLEEREIFFTSPTSFNDPFDCKIGFNFFDMDEGVVERKAQRFFERHGQHISKMERLFRADEKLHEFKNDRKTEEGREKFISNFWRRIEANTAVFSLSEIRHDILMWSHYSDKHKGYCVGFDKEKLIEAIYSFSTSDIVFWDSAVTYQPDYPKEIVEGVPNENPDWSVILITKALQWEYEREYRFILNGGTNQQIVLPDGVISEVLIGALANETTRKEIEEVVQSSNSGIKLFQARLAKDKFALEFDEIE